MGDVLLIINCWISSFDKPRINHGRRYSNIAVFIKILTIDAIDVHYGV